MTKLIDSSTAMQDINVFAPNGVRVGTTTLARNFNTYPAEIDASQATAIYAGDPVKIVATSTNVLKVAKAAVGDKVFGFLRINSLNREKGYVAGMKVEVVGQNAVMYMKASGAINAGADVNSITAASGVNTVAAAGTGKSVIGIALEKVVSGEAVKVLIGAPVVLTANA